MTTIIEAEFLADRYTRANSQRYHDNHMPEIMFRKNFNFEPVKWTCPRCGVDNTVSVHTYSTLNYQPIITPRVYRCHNSSCQQRRLYYRDKIENSLYARYIGKYEDVDELKFQSPFDPIKFYANLKPQSDYNQISLF